MSSFEPTEYLFIPGKNWKLSLAELVSYLEARGHRFKITTLSKSFFVVKTGDALEPSIVDNLGGTIKLGHVLSRIPLETVENAFLNREKSAQSEIKASFPDHVLNEVFETSARKIVFGVSIYLGNPRLLRFSKKMQRLMGSYVKEVLASRGKKARFMGFPKERRLPQLTHVEVLKKDLTRKSAEILFCIGRDQVFAAYTVSVHNPFEFKKRDLDRPVQRKIFAIPPRLAKIMVNLSSCLHGKILLDPFCGVGTILQEAMLAEARVVGMDINPWCVKSSCTNLDWLVAEYHLKEARHRVLVGDSRNMTSRIENESVDCVVTEPDLGPALRHLPTESHARRIVGKLKPLYTDFLRETQRALRDGGKVVLVTPYIRTRNGAFISLNIEEACPTEIRRVHLFREEIFLDSTVPIGDLTKTSSFVDMESRHKTGREIHVLQK